MRSRAWPVRGRSGLRPGVPVVRRPVDGVNGGLKLMGFCETCKGNSYCKACVTRMEASGLVVPACLRICAFAMKKVASVKVTKIAFAVVLPASTFF